MYKVASPSPCYALALTRPCLLRPQAGKEHTHSHTHAEGSLGKLSSAGRTNREGGTYSPPAAQIS